MSLHFKLKASSSKPNLTESAGNRRHTRFLAVLSLLTIIAASSIIAPAQKFSAANDRRTTSTGDANLPVGFVSINSSLYQVLNFFGFGLNADDGEQKNDSTRTRGGTPYIESQPNQENPGRSEFTPDAPDAIPCTFGGTTRNVPSAMYPTIQSAINASGLNTGDTIQVAAGTYTEQLIINRCVNIVGNGQATTFIQAPTTLALSSVPGVNAASIIEVRNGRTVGISNLTITGPVVFPGGANPPDVYGIFVIEDALLKMTNATVTKIRKEPLDGVQNGNAVRAGSVTYNQTGALDFTGVTISDYQKTGIIVSNTGSTASIKDGFITGAGAQPQIGQNGIQINNGATATITNNAITGNVCDNPACSFSTYYSYGVLALDAGAVTVSNNTFNNNDAGVYSLTPGFTSTITGNNLTQTRYSGFDLDQGTNNVSNNFITGGVFSGMTNGPITGIGVLSYTGATGNTVANINGNSITGATQAGIELDDFGGADVYYPTATAEFNRIAGNVVGIKNTTTTSTVSQTNNFWGCNLGPNGIPGCDTTAGLVDLTQPYLKLTGISASPTAVNTNGTSTVSGTNLRFNSSNLDTYTLPGNPHVPNGIVVNYTASFGTVMPTSTTLLNGAAVGTTTFTGGGPYSGNKPGGVTATVDNAQNTASITVNDTLSPTVIINQKAGQPDPTNVAPVEFTAFFNEVVTGFTNSDVSISGVTFSSIVVTDSGDGQTYNIAVTPTSNGVVTATIPAGAAFDPASNPNTASTSTDNQITFFTGAIEFVVDDMGINCLANGAPVYTTIQAAVAAANAGYIIRVCPGTYTTPASPSPGIAINQNGLTIVNAQAAKPTVNVSYSSSGTGHGFEVSASGVTFDGLNFVKSDETTNHNLIYVAANNFTVKNSSFDGPNWQTANMNSGGHVSRGLEITGGLTGLLITNNTFQNLRQPAYINGSDIAPAVTGTVSNNTVTGTKGFVVAGANINFTGNVFGQTCAACGADIALLNNSDPTFYTPGNLLTISSNNDNAYISVQFPVNPSPSGRAVTYVDDSAAANGDGRTTSQARQTVQNGVSNTLPGGTVNVASGTYIEDVNVDRTLKIIGAGAATTTVSGAIGGSGATFQIAANNVDLSGFKITREGNNTTDWNNPGLNTAGLAIQGQSFTGSIIHDNNFYGNRSGIDINNSNGHIIRNNVIDTNRTGIIYRNQTDNSVIIENQITNNFTVGILFLDGSSGTNSPVQTALNSAFINNNISGNWYGQVVDRQTGGSLPAPGNSPKNFQSNWLGTTSPVVTTNNSAEPPYCSTTPPTPCPAQIPMVFGGTATAPGGQPDVAGPASANIRYNLVLTSGTDTNVETTTGRGTLGFQGAPLFVNNQSPTGWFFFDDLPETGSGSGDFAIGPPPAPLGQGSARLSVDANGRQGFGTLDYRGIRLDRITKLQYSSYQTSGNTVAAPSLQFDVDSDLTDGITGYQGRLVYEPYVDPNNTVQQNQWQTWDVLSPTARFYGSGDGNPNRPFSNACPQSLPCTLQQVLQQFPNIGIRTAAGGTLLFKAGGPTGSPFTGYVDKFDLGISTGNTTFDFEPGRPTVTINQAVGQNDPTNASPINFTAVFSTAVTGFTGADVNLSGTAGATTAVVTQIAPMDGTTYNVAVSGMTSSGTVTATIVDSAATANPPGNGGNSLPSTSTDNTVTYDITVPTVVSINRAGTDPTNSANVMFTATFSENVTGVDTGDFVLAATGVTGASITGVTGSGTTYTVTVNTGTGSGTIGLNLVDNDSIIDAATNPLGGTGANNGNATGQVYTIDRDAGGVTINQAMSQPDPTNVSPIIFTVVFDQPVTGFTGSDVVLTGTAGATTAVVTGSGANYNVAVSGMTSSGTVIASIPAGAAMDNLGNLSAASASTDNTVNYFNGAVTFYVDDDGMASSASCDDPDPVPNTIQSAINLASAGDTIRVCPGLYKEELNINKALTLLGPNAAVNPNTGTRTAEAIIVPTTVGNPVDPTFAGPLVVFLGADGITFRGFTVDGNNPILTSGVVFNGQDVDAEFGIYGTETANPNAVINNNIVQNVGEIAVWVTSNNAGGPKNANSSIFDNKVDNVLGAFGQAIRISEGAWVDVKTNVVTRSRVGITIENYYPGNSSATHPASEISDNNITAFRIGIRHNLHYNYVAPGFTIRHNTVNSYVQAVRPSQVTAIESPVDRYQGIRLESIQNGVAVNVFDNILTGNRIAMSAAGYTENSGLYVTNSSTNSANMLLTGNSVTDFIRGANNETPAVPTFNCNNFFGNTTGVYLSSAATNGLTAANNNIIGNGFGMQNDGPANVNAQSNYWGAANGPGPSGPGNGDNVSTNVDFSNFLTAQATCAIVVPKTFPTVTINQVGPDPTNAATINFTVVFSEAVSGFDASDVDLSGSTAGGTLTATVTPPTNGTTYNVAVSGMTLSGTVVAKVKVGAAQSVATTNPSSASTSTDNTVTFDNVALTVTVSPTTGQNNPTNNPAISFTIVFNEPTTNFVQGDVTVTNGTISSFSGSGTTYTVGVTAATSGAVTASVAAGAATDAAGNPNIASNTASVTYDGNAPTVTINQAMTQADPTSASPINFTVVFNEVVTGFATGDVTVGGTAFGVGSNPGAVVTGSGTTYNVAVSGMNQSGTVTATIGAGVAVDLSNNPNAASTSTDNTVTFTLLNPTVSVNPTNTNTAGATMWFGFDDVTDTVIQPSYVEGPTGQPLGVGSSRIRTSATGKYLFANNTTYAGTRLDQITELSYSEYANNPGSTAKSPSLQLGADFNLNDADESFQGRIVFEPYQNTTAPNQPLVQGTWQRWNATNGLFWETRLPAGSMTLCAQDNPCTRAQLLQLSPNVGIHRGALGIVGFRGEGSGGGIGFEGNVDAFTIGVNSVNTTFNFEPTPPTISIGNATVTEGNSGQTMATFTITQSIASQLTTTVTINTANGTATTADNDYQPIVNGTATIPAGQNSATVTVNVNGDTNVEGNETFAVNLSNAVNAAIMTGSGTGTINNDDVVISFSAPTYNAGEGDGTATINVTRNGVTPNPVMVNYATGNGSATGGAGCTTGVDFINTSGTLTFAGNATTQTFTVTICNDLISEAGDPETVNLTLSGVTGGATLGTAAAVLNIFDNDGAGVVTIAGNIQQNNAPSANTNLAGVTVTLGGSASGTTTTDMNGNYSFTGLPAGGSYQVTPSGLGKIYDPIYRNYSSLNVNVTNANFIAYNNIGSVPRRVRVGYSTVAPVSPVTVPIKLDALGNENGASFSITYNTARLSNPVVTLGADATGGTVTSNTATPGVIGVVVFKGSGQTFGAAGAKEIVKITFNTVATTDYNTPLNFTGTPVALQVRDVNANPLQSQFVNGFVVYQQGKEGDVVTNPNGDGVVDVGDVNEISNYAAFISAPDYAVSNQFQRADCEPSATKGNAMVDVGDAIQASNYAAFIDPLQSVGGPAYPIPAPAFSVADLFKTAGRNASVPRVMTIVNSSGSAGGTVTVAITLDAEQGDRGFQFTLDYDPNKLSNPVASLTTASQGALLTQNPNFASGKFIVVVSNTNIPAGAQQILTIQFNIAANAPSGMTPLTLNDTPAQRQVRDVNNISVATNYINGNINIAGPTAAASSISGRVKSAAGKPAGGVTVTLTDSNGVARSVRTSLKGLYRFDEVPTGGTYIIAASDKFTSGAPQIITLVADLSALDLIF